MRKIDFWVGLFVIAGIVAIVVLAVRIGGGRLVAEDSYRLTASFADVGELNEGATVKIAGVSIGKVSSISLRKDYYAIVELEIGSEYKLDKETIASIKSISLLGGKFVLLQPGGSEVILEEGGEIEHTEDAVDIESLIGQFAFGSVEESETPEESDSPDPGFDLGLD